MYLNSTASSFSSGLGYGARPRRGVLQEAAAVAAFCAAAFGAGLGLSRNSFRVAAHRFRRASTIALRPAALSLRFFFGAVAFAVAALLLFNTTQRFRCAAAIFLRADALRTRFAGATAPSVVAFGRRGPRCPSWD